MDTKLKNLILDSDIFHKEKILSWIWNLLLLPVPVLGTVQP